MKKRIFVAIHVSDDIRQAIEGWQTSHKALALRFIKPKNLHLTLIPPWYENPENVIKKLKKFSPSVKPFELQFQRITVGPDPARPRLIWVEGEENRDLTKLKNELEKFLGVRGEKRRFLPHITIVRAKVFGDVQIDESVTWQMDVTTFCLMESRLSPKGAEYETLAEFPLPP